MVNKSNYWLTKTKLFIAGAIILSMSLIAFAGSSSSRSENRDSFIQLITRNAVQANREILLSRQRIDDLEWQFDQSDTLSEVDYAWLYELAKQYNIQQVDPADPKMWALLKQRVDIIPVSLVVAQAVNESAWGRSRFAREGNNYFGQHCTETGCGIVPKNRTAGQIFEVRAFPSVLASVKSYIHTLNTKGPYDRLRAIRAAMREKGETLNGFVLAQTLGAYSERGNYPKLIQTIIEKYNLSKLDKQYG